MSNKKITFVPRKGGTKTQKPESKEQPKQKKEGVNNAS